MNPIKGTRYNLVGLNYDLCEAEFNKLSEDEKTKFVVIARQGDRPVPYGQKAGVSNQETETESDDEDSAKFNHFFRHLFGIDAAPAIHQIKVAFEDINAEMAKKFASQKCNRRTSGGSMRGNGSKKAGHGRHRHGGHQNQHRHCGWNHYINNASVPLGDRLPAGPCGFRSFGPGIAQLQIALIKAGVLDESAVRMHTGRYGPKTAHAVRSLQESYNLQGEAGVFDDKVAAVILGKIDGTLKESVHSPSSEQENQAEINETTTADPTISAPLASADEQTQDMENADVNASDLSDASTVTTAPSANPRKWQAELDVLAGMGFNDEALLFPLLEKHSGSIIFVMTELLE